MKNMVSRISKRIKKATATTKELIDCNQNPIQIDISNPIIFEHFNNPNNYADVVLNYFNSNRIYDFFLQDRNNLNIIDLGANIGLFSLYASPVAKLIVSVEPSPSHFNVLIEMTKRYKNIYYLNVAVSDLDGYVSLSTNPSNTTMNSTVNAYGNSRIIESMTIMSLIDTYSMDIVDFIKCDIEGAEMPIVNEEMFYKTAGRIKEWVIEIHPTTGFSQQENLNLIRYRFLKHGYLVSQLNHETLHAYYKP